MRASTYYSGLTFIGFIAYAVVGICVTLAVGNGKVTDIPFMLLAAAMGSALLAAIVFVVVGKISGKSGEDAFPTFKTKRLAIVLVIAVVLGVAVSYSNQLAQQEAMNQKMQKEKAEQERWASLTPEQQRKEMAAKKKAEDDKKLEDEKQEHEKVLRGQRAILAKMFVTNLREAMRDPDSFKISSVFVNEDATAVCVDYRARNGFGGMNQEFIVWKNNKTYQSADVWNKNCVHNVFNMTHLF